MTARRAASQPENADHQPGQLLFCGFEGTRLPEDLHDLIAAGRIGGVILFARNIESPEQLLALNREMLRAAPPETPLLIAIDQEGGRVQRLRGPWTEWPPMREVAASGDPTRSADVARALARELLDLGIALDFAPVVDVDTNASNPVIGDRSFSREADQVALHASHFIKAMQQAGVAACAKHFPGHGDTATDSHLELPLLTHDLERLRAIELPPFQAAVEAGVASIMTAHVLFPELDGDRPATVSRDVMALLRDDLGYDGVVFSDDLEMKAVADHYAPAFLVRGCLEARVDAVLVCRQAGLRDDVLAHLEASPEPLLDEPLRRVQALKRRFAVGPAPLSAITGAAPIDPAEEAPQRAALYPEHQALAHRVRGSGSTH